MNEYSMAQYNKRSKNYLGNNPKKAKKNREKLRCPECGATIQFVSASQMNFRFMPEDAEKKMYWRCSNYPNCNTYIAANPVTKKMDGIMAGPNLRHKRLIIHQWEQMFIGLGKMDKIAFRQMCASHIGLHRQGLVHTRFMTEMECDTILNYLQRLYENNKDVHDMVEGRPNHPIWKQVRGLNTAPNHGTYYTSDGKIID